MPTLYLDRACFETPAARSTLGPMNVLVVGSGGREHALVWRLARDDGVGELHAAPGNPGIASIARCHPVAAGDGEGLLALCRQLGIDLAVFGPEAPLVFGVADGLRHAGVSVFGPSAAAARIEGSKSFAKDVMRAAGVPTASVLDGPRAPCVVKADGLAAGKGVFVCRTQPEAETAWRRARALGSGVVVEELLEGEEVSVFALADGADAVPLPAARDAKRLLDGDEGPNTGGMGAFSPVPYFGDDEAAELVERVHRAVLAELARRGAPFVGLLYAGIMLTDDGPRVLEFNCRFGDPETQAILPRLEGDFLRALAGAAAGDLTDAGLRASEHAATTVVLASPGYPDAPATGTPIGGLEAAEAHGALVFHAGTALADGALVSAGGRVLDVTAVAPTLGEARDRAYEAIEAIDFAGAHYRRDIGPATADVAR
jgi:phosphoribosylamine---glycine ligase